MSFLTKGKEKEKLFATLFENTNFSDKNADINEHWDLKVEFKVDVKSLKKIRRSDSETNEFYHYIELKNVNGKLGWLYGEADFFAFETNNYWILVGKEDLQTYIGQNTAKVYVTNPDECLYCLYRREGRKDEITMVKTIDLMYISVQIIEKKIDKIVHVIGESIDIEKRNKARVVSVLSSLKNNSDKVAS